MIKVRCRTNLDNYHGLQWPTLFFEVPKKGDKVKSRCGKELYVCGITHCMQELQYGKGDEPYISVELTILYIDANISDL